LALPGVVLMEVGDFAMMRRMLHGIQERAETLHRAKTPDAWPLSSRDTHTGATPHAHPRRRASPDGRG
jgi:hypothetical protein